MLVLPHREFRPAVEHSLVGAPEIGWPRHEPHRRVLLGPDFQIGEILAERKHALLEEGGRLFRIARTVVAIGRLRGVDVPLGNGIARARDADQFFQSARHHGAARLGGMEERVLVDLLRLVRMANKDDLHVLVTALEEDVEQREEPFGDILHVLRHRGRGVHQAEHDSLGDRPRHRLEAPVTDVDRVDERDALAARHEHVEAGLQIAEPVRITAVAERGNLRLELENLVRFGPAQRNAA